MPEGNSNDLYLLHMYIIGRLKTCSLESNKNKHNLKKSRLCFACVVQSTDHKYVPVSLMFASTRCMCGLSSDVCRITLRSEYVKLSNRKAFSCRKYQLISLSHVLWLSKITDLLKIDSTEYVRQDIHQVTDDNYDDL